MSVRTFHPVQLYNGSFFDTTTQTSAGGTSDNLVTVNTTTTSQGVSVVSGSKFVIANTGNYVIRFTGQFLTSGGGSNYNITAWASKNGTAIPNSSYTYTTSGVNGYVRGVVELDIPVNANDYIQFHWFSQNTYAQLTSTAAGTNPTRPAAPSVNVTIYNVG